jgi:hypothetical protein
LPLKHQTSGFKHDLLAQLVAGHGNSGGHNDPHPGGPHQEF